MFEPSVKPPSLIAIVPLQVPSAYFMTDVFLYLDGLMSGNLFKPKKQETKMSLAGVEGLKMKKLVGSLRALWRSSKKHGFDCRVTDLKRYLRPSPDPDRRGDENESHDSPLGNGDDNGDNTDNAAAPEPIHDDVGSEDGSVVGEDDESPNALESPAPSLPPLSPPKSLDESSDEGGCGMAPAQDAGSAVVDGSDSEYSINAPTLELGASDPSESEDEIRCSQVSSGWLGKAYMAHNEIERGKKRQHDEEQYENYLHEMCEFIRQDLEKDLKTSLVDTEMWGGYKRKCYKALDQYGHHVYCDLSNLDNFNAWLSQQKDPAAVNLDLCV